MIRARPRCALLLLLAGAALASSCGDGSNVVPTGIVVEVTSDFEAPSLDAVQLTVTGAEADPFYDRTFSLSPAPLSAGSYSLPLRVGLEPRGDAAAPFRIEAIGRINGASIVERSATMHFIVGRVLLVELPLRTICQGTSCPAAASTCGGTGSADCVPDTVDPGKLPTYQPTDGGAGSGGGGGRGGIGGAPGRGGAPGAGGSIGGAGGIGGNAGGAGLGGASGRGGDGAGGTAGSGGASGSSGTGGGSVVTLNDQLVGYWSFDAAATSFPDHSGNGNNVTALASAWTAAGADGGALDLTAPNAAAGIPGSASVNTITTAIAIGAWVKPGPSGMVRTFISRYLGTGYWKLGFSDNGALRFTVGTTSVQTPSPVSDPTDWTHVVATYDGATARLYVDGTQSASANLGAISLVGGPAIGGGYGPLLGGTFMDITADTIEDYGGQLDELVLYKRALNAAEVTALARGAVPVRH